MDPLPTLDCFGFCLLGVFPKKAVSKTECLGEDELGLQSEISITLQYLGDLVEFYLCCSCNVLRTSKISSCQSSPSPGVEQFHLNFWEPKYQCFSCEFTNRNILQVALCREETPFSFLFLDHHPWLAHCLDQHPGTLLNYIILGRGWPINYYHPQ